MFCSGAALSLRRPCRVSVLNTHKMLITQNFHQVALMQTATPAKWALSPTQHS